jgi:toxin ParE1/3/4
MNVRYRELALADLENISQFLNERSPRGARNVLHAIADAIEGIAAQPLASPRTSDPEIRVILTRYRYKIFYAIVRDEFVEIIHIRHAARRPWL